MGNSNSVEEFESSNKTERNQGFVVPDSAQQASPRRLESFQLDKRFENHVGLPVAVDGYGGGILRFYGRHKLPPHILCGIAMHVPAVEIAMGNQPGIVYLNHKNPTAILCDPQKVTLITDDPFLEQNNITRWSEETKNNGLPSPTPTMSGFQQQRSTGSLRTDPMLDSQSQEVQRQRGEELKRRQEAERRSKMEEAERLRQQQQAGLEQQRQAQLQEQRRREEMAARQAQQDALQRQEEERIRQEDDRIRQMEQQKEERRLKLEADARARKQREEEERIALSQAAEKRLQEAQKRREAALAAGENSANSEAALKAAEAENARILAEASSARKAAEEMQRASEGEERKRVALLEQAERDRIATEAKRRRALAEAEAKEREAKQLQSNEERRLEKEREAEENRRRVEYADRPGINNSDEWWASEEGQRQRDLDARKAERQASLNGPRKATLFDLNSMGTKPETPRALSKGQFTMVQAPERKSGFDVVKRARPEMAIEVHAEEAGDEECTFLGNCKCPNCR